MLDGREAMRLSVSLREGSDGSRIAAHVDLLVSIHAPTKGATYISIMTDTEVAYFNPRSREGSDRKPILAAGSSDNFNPRFREGSDS